jgi:Major Facilitator Superfamily
VATAAIGLAGTVWQVGLLRALAWMSRGVRSPARDTLLVSLVPRDAYGRASGVERAGDNAGALLGPLLAALLVTLVGVRYAIGFAIVPGVLAAVAITVAAREARRSVSSVTGRRTLTLNLRELWHAGLPRALTPAALFELGNVATTLLILRGVGTGSVCWSWSSPWVTWAPRWWPACCGPPSPRGSRSSTPRAGWPRPCWPPVCCARAPRDERPHQSGPGGRAWTTPVLVPGADGSFRPPSCQLTACRQVTRSVPSDCEGELR